MVKQAGLKRPLGVYITYTAHIYTTYMAHVYTTYTASWALGIAGITAAMACSSSEDETLKRVGFKGETRFLVSGSEEEDMEIRRRKGLRKKSSGNNQCTIG